MKKYFFFVGFLVLLFSCATSDNRAKDLNAQNQRENKSIAKPTTKEKNPIIMEMEKQFSVYQEQWRKIYAKDTALYQGITKCMYPSETVVEVGPMAKNLVSANEVGYSIDGESHLFFVDRPNDSLKIDEIRERKQITTFISSFAFVFDEDTLLGVRPQWIERYKSTPEYRKKLSACTEKYGVKVLEEVSSQDVYDKELERYRNNIKK